MSIPNAYRPVVTSSRPLPPWLDAVLTSILRAASLNGCYVTSLSRTPREQATAMFDNCRRTGVAEQYRTYLDAGDQVIAVYDAAFQANPQALDTAPGRQDCIRDMIARIIQVGPSLVSHHCLPDDAPIMACDILQSSILAEGRFLAALRAHPQYSRDLIENNVYHVELFKESPKATS